MSTNRQILKSLLEHKLTAVAEEIFGLFEKTIAEYEEELCRTKEENQRLRQIPDCVLNPRVLIHTTGVQQLSLVKEVPPEQHEWNPIVEQEEPEPEPLHIKEEQEELWTSQEANITKFPSTPVPVKSEDDDENIEFSKLSQTAIEETKVDCGGSEPASSFHPHRHLQTKADEHNEDSEETEDSDDDQTLNHKPESKLPANSSTEQMEAETDGDNNGGSEADINLIHMERVKGRTTDSKSLLEEHMDTHTGLKLVGSSEYETFSQMKNMTNTDLTRSDVGCKKKLHQCSVCLKTFSRKSHLEAHMRIHTGEKPFACSECGRRFTHMTSLTNHRRLHSGERPFSCSECGERFTQKNVLVCHMRLHTGERPFRCSECGRSFTQKNILVRHIRTHTEERPFSCVVCQKRFKHKDNFQIHMKIHM